MNREELIATIARLLESRTLEIPGYATIWTDPAGEMMLSSDGVIERWPDMKVSELDDVRLWRLYEILESEPEESIPDLEYPQ